MILAWASSFKLCFIIYLIILFYVILLHNQHFRGTIAQQTSPNLYFKPGMPILAYFTTHASFMNMTTNQQVRSQGVVLSEDHIGPN